MEIAGTIANPAIFGLISGLVGIACCSALFTSALTRAAGSERFSKYRLTSAIDPLRKVNKSRHVLLIILFDLCLYCSCLVFGYKWLIREGSTGFWTTLVQIFAVLLIYDFGFYWTHRLFHSRFLMRHVHSIHHRVRVPKAVDDYYLHPLDSLWVTTLFFGSIAIVGPLSIPTFILTFLAYVFINNCLHSGLSLPHACFRPINYLAHKHNIHHNVNISSNFASIFPILDKIFGTAHRGDRSGRVRQRREKNRRTATRRGAELAQASRVDDRDGSGRGAAGLTAGEQRSPNRPPLILTYHIACRA